MKAINKMCRLLSLFLIVCSTTGCKTGAIDGGSKKTCYITENEDEISFDDLVKNRKRITLDQHRDSYLSEIQNVFLYEDDFYVLDGKKKAVLVFDSKGRYKRRIGRVGRGPGELLNPSDFAIDKNTGSVKILDAYHNKVLEYSQMGEFINEYPLDGRFTTFHKLDQNTYLYEREISSVVNYSHGGFALIDPEDNYLITYFGKDRKKNFFPISEQRMLDGTLRYNRNCFSTFNDGVLYWQFFDNTIYYLINDQLVEEYAIDFQSRTIPDFIMEEPFQTRVQLLMAPENYEKYRGMINNVAGHKDIIIFSYQSPSGPIFIAWDTEKDRRWRIVDEALDIESPAIFKVSGHQFVSIGYSDFTSENDPQVILTLFEM